MEYLTIRYLETRGHLDTIPVVYPRIGRSDTWGHPDACQTHVSGRLCNFQLVGHRIEVVSQFQKFQNSSFVTYLIFFFLYIFPFLSFLMRRLSAISHQNSQYFKREKPMIPTKQKANKHDVYVKVRLVAKKGEGEGVSLCGTKEDEEDNVPE